MRKYSIIAGLFCLFMLFGCTDNSRYFKVTESNYIQSITDNHLDYENIAKGVVGIECILDSSTSIGSGVCIKSGGYILTNYHVVSKSNNIRLNLSDKTVCKAIKIYTNPDLDISILKADYAIPFLSIGDSNSLKVGDEIIAIGSPLSLQFNHTFTKGIVSALNRSVKVGLVDSDVDQLTGLIQHDASINSGNSGGPIINNLGQVVGINTLKITNSEGLGFAIPSACFVEIINRL